MSSRTRGAGKVGRDITQGDVVPSRPIFCCGCKKVVLARLTYGKEIYPHTADLSALPFWVCDDCKNYVGCHHKTKNRIAPLGHIPTPEIRNARMEIHKVMDPLWIDGVWKRGDLYSHIRSRLGYEFHTSHIKTIEEARIIYKIVKGIADASIVAR